MERGWQEIAKVKRWDGGGGEESVGSKRKQMEEVQRKAASYTDTAASEMSPYCHSREGRPRFPTGTEKHDI